jgi:4-amino-4-deoxy-L-arabinose transferase-like glycosyltransferase
MLVFPRHYFSFYPANAGLLYLYALAGPGGWAAQAVHWALGAVAVLAVTALARTAAGSTASVWAAAIFAATPCVMLMATTAGADLGVAAWAGAGLVMLLTAARRGKLNSTAWWLLSGAMVGWSVGCKYIALVTVAVPCFVLAVLVLVLHRESRRMLLRLGAWVSGLVLVFAPWAVRNLMAVGNPIYPLAGKLFGTQLETERFAKGLLLGGVPVDPAAILGELARALTLRTFEPQGYAGVIGPLYMLLLPVALVAVLSARQRPALLLLAGFGSGLVMWSLMPQLGRYLVPTLVPGAALAGLAWEVISERWARGAARLLNLFLLAVLLWVSVGGVSPLTASRVAASLGLRDNQELLARYVSLWPALAVVNQELPADARLLFVAESRGYMVERSVLLEDPFHTPLLAELAKTCSSEQEMAARLRRLGITHVLLNHHEARRMAAMTGRQSYFDGLDSEAAARLERFLRNQLRELQSPSGVRIMELVPPDDGSEREERR